MESIRIIFFAVLLAIAYGIVHDSVTVRICLEYFTIGHPPILDGTQNPWALALGWGVIATWWMGAGLGAFLALAARAGSLPKLTAPQLLRPMLWVLAFMALMSLVFGIIGHNLAQGGHVRLIGSIAERVPASQHVAYLTDLWAHLAAYGAGALGTFVIIITTLLRRNRLAREAARPHQGG